VKTPGQRGGRTVATHLQTVDILPTVAQALRIRIPWKVDGRSALAPGADRSSGLVHHPHEQPRRFSFRTVETAVRSATRHKLALFGQGDWAGVQRVGPHRELLGRAAADLPAGPATGLRAKVVGADDLRRVDRASGYVPAHVTAMLTGRGRARPHDVAIAINGRIAAVARSAPVRGTKDWYVDAVVPEAALHDGANRLAVLEVSARGGGVALTPLTTAAR
jgi:hypothetical protein